MRYFIAAITLTVALSTAPTQALEKTAVLNVENATCALCGPIVKRTLERVPGVSTVRISENYAMSPPVTAKVVFDDAVTNVEALVAATTNAGYPSSPATFSYLATTEESAPAGAGTGFSFQAPQGQLLALALIAIGAAVGFLIYGSKFSRHPRSRHGS